ncbi:MAG: hypothetical protein Q9167_001664 [Letrouitia subvulpina]
MDPVSIIGLAVNVQQILTSIYKYGQGVSEARREINQLCSELFALKAALEHIRLNIDGGLAGSHDAEEGAQTILASSNFASPEFKDMVTATELILKSLQDRLKVKGSKAKATLQRLTWPIVKDDLKEDIEKLNRLKSFFILTTTSENAVLCRELYLKVCSIDRRLKHQDVIQERVKASKLQQAVKEWIAPHDSHPFYQKALENFQEGTGTWFLDSPFQEWISCSSKPLIWLRAKPGSGKTTLLAAAIKRAQELCHQSAGKKCLAYSFCSFTDQESQIPRNILGSLLVQLCDAVPRLWEPLLDQYVTRKGPSPHEPKRMEAHEVLKHLVESSKQLSQTFIVLDALNESKRSPKILQSLVNLLQECGSIRILISSTEELNIGPMSKFANIVSMKRHDLTLDITTYIDAWLEDDEKLCHLPEVFKEEVKQVLLQKYTLVISHNDRFRWVQCQLEVLIDRNTPREIRNALQRVPSSLEQTYTQILYRIPAHHTSMAKQALFWLAFALKPMTLTELCEASLIGDDGVDIDDDARLLRKETLLEICGSLVRYNPITTEVTMAHSSVYEFLTSDAIEKSNTRFFHLNANTAENSLTRRCIEYMCLPAFSSGCCANKKELMKRERAWPLLTYIAQTLFEHLQHVQLDNDMRSLLLRFFATQKQPNGGNFGAWVHAFLPRTSKNIENSTPLYYSARFGLLEVVRLILSTDRRNDLELRGGRRYSTPLHVASWAGETEVVRELLEAGASVNETSQSGSTGLMQAVKNGYKDIEIMLRAAGAKLPGEKADAGP